MVKLKKGEKVILSAGHSKQSTGATHWNGKTNEWQLTAEYARALAEELTAKGIVVEVIPQDLPLRKRQAIVAGRPGVFSMEIHFNAFNGKAKGAEAFCRAGDLRNHKLVTEALAETCTKLGLVNRGVKLDNQSARGSLGWVKAGGVLWEVCFMDNPLDLHDGITGLTWAKAMANALVE